MRGQLQRITVHAQGRRPELRDHRSATGRATCRRRPAIARRQPASASGTCSRSDRGLTRAWRSSPRSRSTRRPRWSTRLGLGALTRAARHAPAASRTPTTSSTPAPGRYVLTLFERLTARAAAVLPAADEAPGATRGMPVPEPQADAARRAAAHARAASRPPWSTACPASTTWRPTPRTAPSVGAHAGAHAPGRRATSRRTSPTCAGWPGGARPCRVVLPYPRRRRRRALLDERAGVPAAPRRVAGLCRPAARRRSTPTCSATTCMFDERRRSAGFFDFYFAGVDTLLFDIAVASTTGASTSTAAASTRTAPTAFVAAYDARAPAASAPSVRLLPALMRAAALRFWLSRLWDLHLPRDAALLTAHDPGHFERVLRERRDAPWHPAASATEVPREAAAVSRRAEGIVWVRRGFHVFFSQPLGFAALFAAVPVLRLCCRLVPLVGARRCCSVLRARRLARLHDRHAGASARASGRCRACSPSCSRRAGRRLLALLKLGLAYVRRDLRSSSGSHASLDGGTLDALHGHGAGREDDAEVAGRALSPIRSCSSACCCAWSRWRCSRCRSGTRRRWCTGAARLGQGALLQHHGALAQHAARSPSTASPGSASSLVLLAMVCSVLPACSACRRAFGSARCR